jgi:hypothetical protein
MVSVTDVFMESNRYYSKILMKFQFSRQIFEKFSNLRSVQWKPSCSMQTEGQT